MIKTKISILIFIWSSLIFFLNLQYDLPDDYDIAIFWISIILMVGTILYQIFYLNNYKFVLFEIFIFYLLLHLIYQIGYYGLRGSDSYIDYNFLNLILSDHNFSLAQEFEIWHVDGWPMIHLLTSAVTLITKVDPILVAKFFPSFISSVIVLPLFLLVFTIYKDKKVALLACLIFGSIPKFVSFEGLFIRETFGLFVFLLFFYIIYISRKKKDYRFSLLSIILIPVIVFSHHFTTFMLLIFFTTYIALSKIIPFIYRKYKDLELSKVKINIIFLIILVVVLAYWFYIAFFIIGKFFDIFYEVTGVEQLASYAEEIKLSSPISTLRGNILVYGFFFFQGLLSFILFIKLIRKKIDQKIEDVSFTMFLYFSLFYAFLGLFVLGSLLIPDRFLPFGWMFGVIPLTGLLLNLDKRIYKKILILCLVSFLVFNIYNIDIEYYTGNESLRGVVTTEKDYFIAQTISFPDEYFGYAGVVAAIFDLQNITLRIGGRNLKQIGNFQNFSTLAIINEDIYLVNLNNFKQKSIEVYNNILQLLSYKNQKDIDKICDLGNIYVLRGGKMN